MTLSISLTTEPETLVDVFGITPDRTTGLSLAQIERLPIFLGNRRACLADLFRVTGRPGCEHHVWQGQLKNVNGLGSGLENGQIEIASDIGNHVGCHMRGGTIRVVGNVGDHLGAELTGGIIHVQGSAGDLVGAAYAGSPHGQNGGAILIDGSAGNSVGQFMRRGMIAVANGVGDCCGYLMRAGTIVVGGGAKKNCGLEMVRGTIVLGQRPDQLIGFRPAGAQQPIVARLIHHYLADLRFSPTPPISQAYELFHGDLACGGRGELLIAAN